MASQYTELQFQAFPLPETSAVASPENATEIASFVPVEPLNLSTLVEQGGIAVATILAISVFVLALTAFAKVLLRSDRED